MRMRRRSICLSNLLLAGTMLASPVLAAEASTASTTNQVGEVIIVAPHFVPSGAITASKTTARLIEQPQSVSVISRDQIDLLNFTDVQQAVRYTAGVVGENFGPDLRFDFLTIRGFTPVEFVDGLQAPVSATIPDVGLDLYGFEAVDILKGPASALYGSAPPGGLYNLTSRRPFNTPSGELQVKYGEDDFKQAAGTVTGQIADGLSARLTALYRDRDSQVDFVNAKRAYVAPAVSYERGDSKITLLGNYQWDRVNGDTNGFLPAKGVLFPNPVGTVSEGINLGEPGYNFYRRKQWGVGYELTHRFSDAIRFTQNAHWGAYHEYQQVIYGGGGLGADNRTVSRFNFPSNDDVRQFAVDSRFDIVADTGALHHRILAGVDYRNYREASGFAFAFASPIDLFNPVYSTTPIVAPTIGPFKSQRLRQTGFYLQDQAKIGDLVITVSGRRDHVAEIDYIHAVRATKDKFTWRAGAAYVTDIGVAPYLSYATSFQPQIGQTLSGQTFSPSLGKQVEGGVKYDAANLGPDVKLFATAAVFRIEQTNVPTTDPTNTAFQIQTGKVVSKGLELEAVTRIRQQLSINTSYSYVDAKVTRDTVAVVVGAHEPAQPKHKVSAFIDYTAATGAFAGLGGGFGVRYLSSSPGTLPSAFDPLTYDSPAVTLFDATLHYDRDDWRLAVNASNLLDKRYAGRCNGPSGCYFGARRQVIGTVTRKF